MLHFIKELQLKPLSIKKLATSAGCLAALLTFSNGAQAACTSLSMFLGATSCVDTVNNTETGLATTNAQLATTNAQLAATNAQLTAGDTATLNAANGYTDYRATQTLKAANQYTDTKAIEAKAYTDSKSTETLQAANTYTNDQVQKLDTKTAGGIAAMTAMVNIPAPTTVGKALSVGVGIGTYDGQTAIAIGGQKRFSDNGLVRFGIASGTGKGAKAAVGVGAAWEF
jgi:hypothetical protein